MRINIKKISCAVFSLFLVGISIIILIFNDDLTMSIVTTLYNILTSFLLLSYAQILKTKDATRKIFTVLLWGWSFWYAIKNSIKIVIKLFFT